MGPSRINTGINGNAATTPMAYSSRHPMSRDPSFASSNPSQRRPPGPAAPTRRPTQEYEMHPPTPINTRLPPSPGTSGGYMPFNPSSQQNPQQGNVALPYRPPPVDYFGESNVPQRAGTAPVASNAGVYDDSIYDAYGASEPSRQQPTIPFRPATAGPGPSAGSGGRAA